MGSGFGVRAVLRVLRRAERHRMEAVNIAAS